MSAPILLSTFLKGLSGKELPPEVEEHRLRLRRAGIEAGTIDRHLQKWATTLAAERSRLEELARVDSVSLTADAAAELRARDEEARKGFGRAVLELARVLEDVSQRILADAPSLDGYEDVLQFFKARRVYVPEPFPARDFEPHDEHNSEEYRQLVVDAMNLAVERARKSFVPQVRRFNWAIALLGVVALNSLGVTIFLFKDNPMRLSIGLLTCFDALLAAAYLFYRMSRSKEFQLRAHIQGHMEEEVKRARAEIVRREEERYKQFLEEERLRREAWEKEQDKKRVAFDRSEAQRLESLQPLFAGKTPAIQAVLSTLLPLRLPVPCGVSFKVISTHTIEITLNLPDDRILTPDLQRNNRRGPTVTSREEQDLAQQCTMVAASLAIRHAAEVMFNVPSCNNVVINGMRSLVDPDTRLSYASQALHAEIDRKNLGPMGRTTSPLLAIKRFKHRLAGQERMLERRTA